MTTIVNGTTGITFSDSSVQNTAAIGFRNRIINGAMVIDQRNAGASVTQTTAVLYPVDRFGINGSVTSKFTAQRSTTAPAGFSNSLLFTSSAATTPGSTDYYLFRQAIEGFNTADFAFGSASAQSITLSFWVRSSLGPGTFGGSLFNASANRVYVFSYTISAANTWEYKTITIAGDTTGTWATDNTVGLYVDWSLGAGSSLLGTAGSWGTSVLRGPTGQTNFVATSGATFYITGVQLEKGTTASSFDFRSYGQELALCQRYYWTLNGRVIYLASYGAASLYITNLFFPVAMRATPTITNNLSSPTVPVGSISTLGFGIYNSTAGSNFDAATASAEL
jgi:hypothetical protein